MHPSGIITLTTDFGTVDGYVGAVKGVILSLHPAALIVDITHDIPPQDVGAASRVVADACRWFPAGTLHLAVVDPGVGTARKALIIRTDRHLLVGPDNGIFTELLAAAAGWQAYAITTPSPPCSRTFHARDLFAPAAARALAGTPASAFGPPVDRPQLLSVPAPTVRHDGSVRGRVRGIDRFGNIVTTLPGHLLRERSPAVIRCGGARIRRCCETYAQAPPDTLFLLVGSANLIEIAVRDGSAHRQLPVTVGDEVVLATDR